MAERALAGIGVLVTRAVHQAGELVAAIEQHGGTPILFPTIEILARDATADATRLPQADIVIFVSSNAVQYGLPFAGDAQIAAVGPATAAAIEAAGRRVDIIARNGFDSEHLLATAQLQHVAGKTITIIRGQDGRELLGDTLLQRGARISYLAVYERRLAEHTDDEISALLGRWRSGQVKIVTVMSVAAFKNLIALLPEAAHPLLTGTRLVTPAARVLKEAMNQFPDLRAFLSDGPDAAAMVRAMAQIAPGKSS